MCLLHDYNFTNKIYLNLSITVTATDSTVEIAHPGCAMYLYKLKKRQYFYYFNRTD